MDLDLDLDLDMTDDRTSESLLCHTPPKRLFPEKVPPGILMTPGISNSNKKKAVSFAASTSDEVKPRPQARIRSNLPNDLPGKFPSPWTPKTVTPKGLEDAAASVKRTLFNVNPTKCEDNQESKIEARKVEKEFDPIIQAKVAAHNETFKQTDESSFKPHVYVSQDDADITLNLDLPRSTSGKYWKGRVEEVEEAYEQTLVKAQKWQEASAKAKDYAGKKDAQCAEMAERLREYVRENMRLLEDLKEAKEMQNMLLSRLGSGRGEAEGEKTTNRQLTTTSKDVEDLRATIAAYEKKIVAMEELIQEREEEVAQLSMYIEESPDAPIDSVVRNLRKQLRKAHLELREMTLVKVDNESKNLRLITLERELSTFKSENSRLEGELRDARGGVGETTHLASYNRSLHENRLRLQVERLEQDKIKLMSEMREKVAKEAQERREMERQYKGQIHELDIRLDAATLTAEKKSMEHGDLLRRVGELEKHLSRKSRELDDALWQSEELRKNVAALAPAPGGAKGGEDVIWQAKQRSLLGDLRMTKEEASELRIKLEEKERECQGVREEVVRLRFKLHGMDVGGSGSGSPGPRKEGKDQDVKMQSPVEVDKPISPPRQTQRSRLSRTSLATKGAAVYTNLSSPSKQLHHDLKGMKASASPARFSRRERDRNTSPSGFLTCDTAPNDPMLAKTTDSEAELFAASVPTFAISASTSAQATKADLRNSPLDTKLDMFNTSVIPSSPPEVQTSHHRTAITTTTTNTTNATTSNRTYNQHYQSPRPRIIPVSFAHSSSSSPDITIKQAPIHPHRVTKRGASLGNDSIISTTQTRRVSAGSVINRRMSLPAAASGGGAMSVGEKSASGMDAARREAAKARLAEKKRVRLARALAAAVGNNGASGSAGDV